jgi:ATP-binding cassette, subfamily B, bacterial IrtB/YbtQ
MSQERSDLAAFRRLWRLTASHRGTVLFGMACRLLQAIALAFAITLAIATVAEIAEGAPADGGRAAWVAGLMGIALVLQVVFAVLATNACWTASHRIAGHLRLAMLHRLRDLPMDFHRTQQRGDAVAAMTSDMLSLEVFIADGLPRLAYAVGLPVTLFCLLLRADGQASLIVVVFLACALPILLWSSWRLAELAAGRQDDHAAAAGRVVEYVHGMKVIRAFNRIADGHSTFRQALDRLHDASVAMVAALTVPVIAFGAVVMLGLPVLVIHLGYRHGEGAMAIDTLVTVLGLGAALYPPVLSLVALMETTRLADASLARMERIFAAASLPESKEPAAPRGFDIAFRNVGFSYAEGKAALRGVSFTVPERSMLAIVGPSGAGKSTILNLLLRFWDVGEGHITLGGIDLRDMSHATLAAQVAVVFQDIYLFSGSIHEAIAEGRPGASRADVERAAGLAQAHGFIMDLPQGYETLVGEAGAQLSGGERQRIAIARAILKDAPIVLLDEATAAIDPSNERAIQIALGQLVANRTLVVVAHRLSTIRSADQILVMDEGSVCEHGSFETLLERGGLFARLWNQRAKAARWQVGRDDPDSDTAMT